jgi:oligopeptide/dipeptide ABC transporter ATP-binding protein
VTGQTRLAARSLSVGYRDGGKLNQVLLDVDVLLQPNRILGIAGESGCGKSTLALSLAGYRGAGATVLAGSVEMDGTDLTVEPVRALRRIWGARIAYLAQDSANSLNPAMKVGRHFVEALAKHRGLGADEGIQRAAAWLERVEIPGPALALHRYPHQFSGGQQQRIALALALACEPEVLLLDEPTTGLDVMTQAQVNRLLTSLVRELGMATLYVSHNLALLATVCDELVIMYAGQVVESGPARQLYLAPRHPYTRALLGAVPDVDGLRAPRGLPGIPPPVVVPGRCAFAERCQLRRAACMAPVELRPLGTDRSVRCVVPDEVPVAVHTVERAGRSPVGPDGDPPLLSAHGVRCEFRQSRHVLVAVDDVSVDVARGQVLGIAGESGSGKSTLLKAIAGLVRPVQGKVVFRGAPLQPTAARRPTEARRSVQIVFQNPDATLNPKHTVLQVLERPVKLFHPEVGRRERLALIEEMMERVRLPAALLARYPRSLSGGQRQRVAIGRALLAGPEVILCDEVTSALDVSVQASILELLADLRDEQGLSLVFVTHDLGVLRAIADEAVIMQEGTVIERGPTAQLLSHPRQPYTQRLLEAVPSPQRSKAQAQPSAVLG